MNGAKAHFENDKQGFMKYKLNRQETIRKLGLKDNEAILESQQEESEPKRQEALQGLIKNPNLNGKQGIVISEGPQGPYASPHPRKSEAERKEYNHLKQGRYRANKAVNPSSYASPHPCKAEAERKEYNNRLKQGRYRANKAANPSSYVSPHPHKSEAEKEKDRKKMLKSNAIKARAKKQSMAVACVVDCLIIVPCLTIVIELN